jgi:hypothetical protein
MGSLDTITDGRPELRRECDHASRGTGSSLVCLLRAGPRARLCRLGIVAVGVGVRDDLAEHLRGLEFVDAVERGLEQHATSRVILRATEWREHDFDPQTLDARLAGSSEPVPGRDEPDRLEVAIDGTGLGGRALCLIAAEVLTRCQRLIDTRNEASLSPAFGRAIETHRALHDTRLPLVAADLAHTLDVREWMLRLDREASLAAQLATLFHDVERLASEALVRVEQKAQDYLRFKVEHARAGARMAVAALLPCGFDDALLARVAELVERHEVPDSDPELLLLNDADALSFFSLNSPGFADYYGPEHTRRKVRYTVARASPRARTALARVRLREDVERLVVEELTGDPDFAAARQRERQG